MSQSTPEVKRRWRAGRIAAGMCSTCNNAPRTVGSRCKSCRDAKVTRENARVALGLCRCGSPARSGKVTCQACVDRHRIWCEKPENKRKVNDYHKRKNAECRLEVLKHYGNRCGCCGESGLPFLTIDHKSNGKEDRAAYNSGYWWRAIIRNDFPDHLQILCWNCNMAKQHFGGGVECPHKLSQSKIGQVS